MALTGNALKQRLEELVVAPTTQINRRCAIFEQDGVTPWEPVGIDDIENRLIDGSVGISSTSDAERRTGDITLENIDGALKSHPGGFWYDKIIKLYRGIDLPTQTASVIIIQDNSGGATAFKTMLGNWGYTNVSVNLAARSMEFLKNYDVIVALGGQTAISNAVRDLLNQLYAMGKGIYTNGNDSTATNIPLIATTQTKGTSSPNYRIEPAGAGHIISYGWANEDESADTGTLPTAVRVGATPVAQMTFASTLSYTAIAEQNSAGGRWFHYHDYVYGTQSTVMHRRAFSWLDDTRDRTVTWEYQLGEFMIDDISSKHEPSTITVKFRDYVKKCQKNGFKAATTFKKGTDLDACIRALAANAGIKKISIGDTGKTLGHDFAFESGTDRWKAMNDLATAYGYDLYFDNTGTLIMPTFPDPAQLSSYYTFKTGSGGGNLASYEKSSNDSRIYNHIIVVGQSTNSLPVYGEAINNVAGSPTSVDELGDRVYRYNSSYITTAAQALATAKSFLGIYALEEFSLSFSSVVVPWLEAGHVVNFTDPDPAPGDPISFLLSELTIPLGLGEMSSTAKRVRRVTS